VKNYRLLFVLIALAAPAVPAWADDWHGDANYPARVVAFTFGAGVLDSNHPVWFGAWTVSFGAQGFQTIYIQDGGINGSWYNTGNPATLACANAVAGKTGCAMFLYPKSPTRSEFCMMALLPDIGGVDNFKIPCPTGVKFQR
jgi:hypothetical protein